MQQSRNKCSTHDLQKTHICLKKSCSGSFETMCIECSKEKHTNHNSQLITLEDFTNRLNKVQLEALTKTTQLNLFDLHNKISLLRNFRNYILEKESQLFLNNLSLKITIDSIHQEHTNINKHINNLRQCQQLNQYGTYLKQAHQFIQINQKSGHLRIGNSKVRKNQQNIHQSIMDSLLLIGDLRDYLVKIIEVLMEENDVEEMEYVKRSTNTNCIQNYLKEMLIQQQNIVCKQIKSKIEILNKINPQHQLYQELTAYRPLINHNSSKDIQKFKDLQQDVNILNNQKHQLQNIVLTQTQTIATLQNIIQQLSKNKQQKILEVCSQIANLKCQLQIIKINNNSIKEEFVQMIYNQIEDNFQNASEYSQIINNIRNILNCEDKQIIQKISQFLSEFNNIIQQKKKIISDHNLLKEESEQFHNKLMHNLAALAEMEEKNNILTAKYKQQSQNAMAMRNSQLNMNQYIGEIIQKNQALATNISELNLKIQHLQTEKLENNIKISKNSLQLENLTKQILDQQKQLKINKNVNNELLRKIKNYEENSEKDNKFKYNFIQKKIDQLQQQNQNNNSKIQKQSQIRQQSDSLIKRKISKQKKPKDTIQITVDSYKNEADQKLNILKNSIKLKESVINNQKQQIQRLSNQKNKSKQKSNSQNERLKSIILLKAKQQKINLLNDTMKTLLSQKESYHIELQNKNKQLLFLKNQLKFFMKNYKEHINSNGKSIQQDKIIEQIPAKESKELYDKISSSMKCDVPINLNKQAYCQPNSQSKLLKTSRTNRKSAKLIKQKPLSQQSQTIKKIFPFPPKPLDFKQKVLNSNIQEDQYQMSKRRQQQQQNNKKTTELLTTSKRSSVGEFITNDNPILSQKNQDM